MVEPGKGGPGRGVLRLFLHDWPLFSIKVRTCWGWTMCPQKVCSGPNPQALFGTGSLPAQWGRRTSCCTSLGPNPAMGVLTKRQQTRMEGEGSRGGWMLYKPRDAREAGGGAPHTPCLRERGPANVWDFHGSGSRTMEATSVVFSCRDPVSAGLRHRHGLAGEGWWLGSHGLLSRKLCSPGRDLAVLMGG